MAKYLVYNSSQFWDLALFSYVSILAIYIVKSNLFVKDLFDSVIDDQYTTIWVQLNIQRLEIFVVMSGWWSRLVVDFLIVSFFF